MAITARLLLTAAACLALPASLASGAATLPTPSQVRIECRSQVSSNCFETCDSYQAMLEESKFASKRDCRRACDNEFQRLSAGSGGSVCERAAGKGQDLCNLYCNQTYK